MIIILSFFAIFWLYYFTIILIGAAISVDATGKEPVWRYAKEWTGFLAALRGEWTELVVVFLAFLHERKALQPPLSMRECN
jgi:hypothetical protein